MTEYFASSTSGNNSNNGLSWAAAKLTASAAVALATSPGDIVYLRGVFRETITIPNSGGNSYTTGTVSVTNGSAVVTGSGTSWLANAFAGGVFRLHVLASGTDGVTNGTATFTSAAGNFQAGHVGYTIRVGTKGAYIISAVASATSITLKNPDGSAPSPTSGTGLTYNVGPESPYDILSVDSNTQITLTQPWAGPSLTGIAYETWRPIRIIGDVSGYKTDGVGGVVRLTGSDNDTTTTRSNCIAATSKNYIVLSGINLDSTSSSLIALTTCTNWIIQDCTSLHGGSANIISSGAGAIYHTIRRCMFLYGGANSAITFSHSASVDNAGHVVENCILMQSYNNCLVCTRVGGVLVRNNLFSFVNICLTTSTLSTGQAESAHNNLFICSNVALNSGTSGDIMEDYNDFHGNTTARTNTVAGSNSSTALPLVQIPLFLAGYRFPWQFGALSPYSTLAAKAGFNPPADDFFGLPRPATNAKNSWGAIQFNPVIRDTTTVDAGSASLKLTDVGRHQVVVNVTNASTTISIKVYREASYAGSNPGFVIRQAGQADIVVTDAGSSGAFNTITTTFTPAATTNVVFVDLFSLNTATSGSFAVYFDTLLVTTALTTGGFEQWITDRIPLANYAGAPGGGGVSVGSNGIFGGSVYKKNLAVTGFEFVLIDKLTGAAITSGTVTGYITKDGGSQTTLGGTPTHKGNGQWNVDITQTEMNADVVGLVFTHANSVNVGFTIRTVVTTPDDTYTRVGAAGAGLTALGDTRLANLDAAVSAVKAKTDNLPAAPASTTNITAGTITTVGTVTNPVSLTGDLTATMKTSVTTAATAATPTAAAVTGNVGGNVVGSVGSVSAAVTVGTINANVVNASALATDAVAEIQSGLATATNVTSAQSAIQADIAAVQTDTDDLQARIGTNGSGLTALASAANLSTANTNISAINTKLGTPAGATVSADVAAVKSDTGSIATSVAALPNASAIVTALMAYAVETGKTLDDVLQEMYAVIRGKAVADDATTPTQVVYYAPDDTTPRVTHGRAGINRTVS